VLSLAKNDFVLISAKNGDWASFWAVFTSSSGHPVGMAEKPWAKVSIGISNFKIRV
jgi:hypothetical protein